jgi:hypothetical protein
MAHEMIEGAEQALKAIREFKKDDATKPEFEIVSQFAAEIGRVNEVLKYGASKYGMENWKNCDDLNRYRNAATRHLLQSFISPIDNDSGHHHLASVIANSLFILALERLRQTSSCTSPSLKQPC